MDFTTPLVVTCFVIVVIFFICQSKSGQTPPGPIGLPIVGYMPFMTSKPYVELQRLAKEYGSVFSLQLGSQNVIVLSDYECTKDAFAEDAFMGRPTMSPFDQLSKATLETGAINGLVWEEQRKFSVHMLRDLGFGKSKMEDMMKAEISDLLEHFEKTEGRSMSPRTTLSPSMSNNIAVLMYGKRRKYDDPTRIKIDKNLADAAAAAGQMAWQVFLPWVAKVMNFLHLGNGAKFHQIISEGKKLIRDEIEQHNKTFDESNIRDYIDAYLLEIRKRNDPAFCEEVLEDLVGMFFAAGSETVRLTMDWLMLTMAAYTDVQQRIQSEIDTAIGRGRLPSWKDYPHMPYTQATIMELMRWRTIFPINILRYTLWDTELDDYFIPKDSIVVANLWSIHHDLKNWGDDAEIFRPERFLTEDGKNVVKSKYFIPFSIGKRACPAESYAKMEIFMYFVAVLQKFNVTLPDGALPNFDGELGIGLAPKPYQVCLNKRS